MSTQATSSVEQNVLNLKLPGVGSRLQAGSVVSFSPQRQSLAVGAQLTEFTGAVAPDVRQTIADSILLAQLATQNAAGSEEVLGWYREYTTVLEKIGWQKRDFEFVSHRIDDEDAELHKAITPVLAVMLGPQAAAASMVLSVLKGLSDMDQATSWITVFDRMSQHSRGAKFQVSYVDANAQGEPEITVLCLGVEAESKITQVLFFRFSSQKAELKKASGKLAASMNSLNSVRDIVADRVQPFMREYVANVAI